MEMSLRQNQAYLAQKDWAGRFASKNIHGKKFTEACEPLALSEHNALSQRMFKQQQTKEDAVYCRVDIKCFLKMIDSTYGFLR
jgi:hypothetical protein